MSETRYSLLKDAVSRKVLAWLLVLAMVFGLTPTDFSLVVKAAGDMNISVHYQPKDWTRPAVQAWNGTFTLTGDGEEEEVTNWGGAMATPMKAEEDGWYVLTIQGNPEGFQFVDLEEKADGTHDCVQGYQATMASYNDATPTDLYFIDGVWYLDQEGKTEMPIPKPVKATIYFYNAEGFTTPVINAWQMSDITLSGTDGTATIEKWNQDKDKLRDEGDGWFSVTIECTGAIQGIQIVDAETAKEIKLSDDALKIVNECNSTDGTDVFFDGTVMSLDRADIPLKDVVSPENPTSPEKPDVSGVMSPVYNEDGTITFNLVSDAAKAGIKGKFIESWSKILDMEKTEYGYTKSFEAPELPGIYDYGMVSGTTEDWEGDPLNKTKIANGNPVIVANPVEGNGEVVIYYPSADEITGSVLYRIFGSDDEYKSVNFAAAEGYEALYAATITGESAGEYEYLVKIGDAEPAADTFNHARVQEVNGTKVSTFTMTASVTMPDFRSPVINGDGTVTFYYWAPSAKEVFLAGNMNGWSATAQPMTKDEETGLFSVTLTLSDGSYQYKYVVDGDWVTDQKNEEVVDGNSAFTLGETYPIVDADKGTITFVYFPEDYANVVAETESVNLMGEPALGTDWNTGLPMEFDETDGTYKLTVKDITPGKYEYKFRANNATWLQDKRNPDGTDNSIVTMPGLMIVGDNLAGAGQYQFTADGVADEGSIVFSLVGKKTGFKITKDGLVTVKDNAKTGYFTLRIDYTVDGVEKYTTNQYYYSESAVIYEYEYSTNEQYKGQTDAYTWNNAASGTSFMFRNIGTEEKEKYAAYITLDDQIESFGYIIRLYGSWGDGDREYADRTIYVNQGEKYTKLKGGDGIEKPYVCASGKTGYDNGIIFRYRDDQKFHDGTMDTIDKNDVFVVINGKKCAMEYSEKDELFTYEYKNIATGDYEYYFLVEGEVIDDQYNPEGKLRYENASKVAVSYNSTMYSENTGTIVANYDQNPAIEYMVTNEETGKAMELSSIVVDLAPVAGGKEAKVAFSTVTNKGVLYIDRSVKPGTYDLPVEITDNYGNVLHTYIPLTVVDKTTTDPSWDEAVVYFIVTDRFNDGDPSNNGTVGYDPTKAEAYRGGDLKGITQKISYLQELGINTIWITPIVDNVDYVVNEDLTQTGYHGYWAKDFTKLDEHLGTTADLDELIDEAHKHGIKVMVDIVVNHSGYADKQGNGLENFKGMLREGDEIGSDFLHGGYNSDLPDFKTEDQEVRSKLIAWQTAWASHTTANGNSIDYFRVDTVKHVEHETWSQLKTALAEVNPYFKMIGEFYGATCANTGDYLGNGEMDSELDFDFKSVAGNFVNGRIDEAEASLESRNGVLTSSVTMGQFLSSHDEDGFVYSQGGDLTKGKLAASLQMTTKGQVVIYYGEEIGLSGPNAFGLFENNRYNMVFDNLTDDQKAMLTHYKKLLAARNMYSEVFATGDRTKLAGGNEDGYLVFKRGTGDNAVYVAINTTEEEKEVTFGLNGIIVTPETPSAGKLMKDIYSGQEVTVVNDTITIKLPKASEGGTAIIANGKELTGMQAVAPTKTTYTVGDKLDLSNLSVFAVYGDSKISVDPAAYTVDTSAVNMSKAGTYKITVSYGNYKDTVEIVVNEVPKKPTPTATSAPKPTQAVTNKYTISYVLNKGTNNKSNPASYTTKDVTLKNPTRKGYTFKGWYTTKDFKSNSKITTIKASNKKNITVYARWSKVTVKTAAIKTAKNSSSKKIKLTLKKVSGAKGYQVKYSTSKKFSKSSSKTTTTTKTSKTLTKLTKNKTYYVKVRAYKLDSAGKKVYGKWSKVKTVKVTK